MSGFLDDLRRMWNTRKGEQMQRKYAMWLSGQMPVYSQFGENIYASDIVQWCIGYVATEISKLKPRHIRHEDQDRQVEVQGPINRMLRISPNPIMTTKDYLEKTIWQLYLNYNCFIYPQYERTVHNDGSVGKRYKYLWPLAPRQVAFVTDPDGILCVELLFGDGKTYTFEYSELIHLRLKYSVNDYMGGNNQGQPDTGPLLATLQVNHDVTQMLPMALKTSMGARFVLKAKTVVDTELRHEERKRFNEQLERARGGLLITDIAEELVPMNINPKLVDKDTMAFLEQKVFRWFGVSLPVISGDFTDEQYQAVYEKTLEPLVIGMGQAYSKTLFTQDSLDRGNEIAFYPQALLYSNTKNKIAVADILGNRGALTDNQLLALFGYPPFAGGDKRQKSLNFINRDIADNYQLLMAMRNRKGGSTHEDIQTLISNNDEGDGGDGAGPGAD